MKKNAKALPKTGSWSAFLRMLGQINLPWLMILIAFIFEVGYNRVLLSLPTTTSALFGGSLDGQALRDAVLYYITYGLVVSGDFWFLGITKNLAVRNARIRVWSGMMRTKTEYYDSHAPAALSSAISNDVESAVTSLVGFIVSVLPGMYYIVAATVTIGEYDILLLLSILVLLPLKWLYMVVISRKLHDSQVSVFQRIGVLTGYLAERVKNLPLIKQFTNEPEELENGTAAIEDLRKANMRKVKVGCVSTAISSVLGLMQHLVTIVFGVILLQKGRITIEQWIAFFLFASQINSRFSELIGYWQTLKSAQGMAARVVEIMEAPKEQSEQQAKAAATEDIPSQGAEGVEFHNVSFSYGEKEALKKVSFTVPAGKATAIVGLCGSGKTTLLSLLERFYETGSGEVLLGNQDVKAESLSNLRGRFSYVQQGAGVFSGTVREILTYGLRREVSEEELTEAAKSVGAWEFISALPQGLDSEIAADGSSLSGGQRQRLVLAREFLRNADILLLDEPTSALDATTAQAVEETILRVFRGKTILMITHDMSLLKGMDQVVVMEEGEVKGCGTYETLLSTCPLLNEMVQMQNMGVILA